MFIRKKKARTILWAITGTLVFASSAAITSAYFTSTDQTVRNILTPGTVRIPVKTISLVDLKTHRKQPETRTELFTFEANKNWELLERTEEENSVRYVYGYRELIAPQQETEKLFETITAVSYLEGSLDAQEVFRIPVTAQAIQKNIAPEGTGLKEIYQIYLEQQEAERSAEA